MDTIHTNKNTVEKWKTYYERLYMNKGRDERTTPRK